jgi:hypothetical protein
MPRSTYLAIALVALALAGCGGDDDDGGSGSDLPEPASGKATVGGKLTRDGKALAGQDVALNVKSKERLKTKTGQGGEFVLANAEPGTYTVVVRAEVESGATEDLEARGGKLTSCEAPGYGPQGEEGGFTLGSSTVTSQGGTRFKTFQTLESEPFDAKAGDRITKNAELTCEVPEA